MHPAFSNIRYGPFHTDYHRVAVDDGFCEALSAYLEEQLLPQVEDPFESTEGSLVAEFDEEKYCGPASFAKGVYKLNFAFVRASGRDDVEVEIYRDPKTGAFRVRRPFQSLVLRTEREKVAKEAFTQTMLELVGDIMAGKPVDLTCPSCGRGMDLRNAPDHFCLHCLQGCFLYYADRDPDTGDISKGTIISKPRTGGRDAVEF